MSVIYGCLVWYIWLKWFTHYDYPNIFEVCGQTDRLSRECWLIVCCSWLKWFNSGNRIVLAISCFSNRVQFFSSCLNKNMKPDIADSFRMEFPWWKMLRPKISEKSSLKKKGKICSRTAAVPVWVFTVLATRQPFNCGQLHSNRVNVYTFSLTALPGNVKNA